MTAKKKKKKSIKTSRREILTCAAGIFLEMADKFHLYKHPEAKRFAKRCDGISIDIILLVQEIDKKGDRK